MTYFFSLSLSFVSVNVMAEAPATQELNCSQSYLSLYFPESFVKETFAKFNVPKDKWDALIKALNEKDQQKQVFTLVNERASKMTPNPLKDPSQRQEAVKLFKSTLLEVFSDALKANGITDDAQILSMLEDIQQQKAKHFALCIKKDAEANKDLDDNDDDSDDDDNDDSDDDDEDDNDDEDDVKADDKKPDAPSDTTK